MKLARVEATTWTNSAALPPPTHVPRVLHNNYRRHVAIRKVSWDVSFLAKRSRTKTSRQMVPTPRAKTNFQWNPRAHHPRLLRMHPGIFIHRRFNPRLPKRRMKTRPSYSLSILAKGSIQQLFHRRHVNRPFTDRRDLIGLIL
jgi:hypothetical protein